MRRLKLRPTRPPRRRSRPTGPRRLRLPTPAVILAVVLATGLVLAGLAIPAAAALVGLPATSGMRAARHASSAAPLAAAASSVPAKDGVVDLAALYHDSRDGMYRTPGGAVTSGTTVTLRLRAAHDDLASATLRVDDALAGKSRVPMAVEAADVPCGAPPAPSAASCDLWSATVVSADPTTIAYSFEVADGAETAYVLDDDRRDGGAGAASKADGTATWRITVYAPDFAPIDWMRDAVVYQVFPDRFANGDPTNDPSPDASRYGYPTDADSRIVLRPWGVLPEQPGKGRDYYGGDLDGIRRRLPYLKDLGVTVLYLNPVFSAASNHRYDTRDYTAIDASLGTAAEWDRLVTEARAAGIRILLDGVFNHVSSDSPSFDRYGHFPEVGACESVDSPYRTWFFFRAQANGPCAGPDGPHTMGYTSWANFDSLPVLNKRDAAVRDLIMTGADAVAPGWLRRGAAGWRLDVMIDGSFPDGFWQEFRRIVKATSPDAPIVAEAWKRDDALRFIRGDTADGTMGYRFRNAVLGYLGTIDMKGFPDDGESQQPPSVFAGKIRSILEDEPAAAVASTLNLLDSHDTERALWSLTPGDPTRAARELDAANVDLGRARLRLASLIQFTMPGPPTIYYGDEIAMTGDTDPDDRRTFPVLAGEGAAANGPAGLLAPGAGKPDAAMRAWYARLAQVRHANPVLRTGDVRFLLADDATRVVAWERSGTDGLAVVAVNPDPTAKRTVRVRVDAPGTDGAPLRDGITFADALQNTSSTSHGGMLELDVGPSTAVLLVATPGQDLGGLAAPTGATVARAAGGATELRWDPAAGATAWDVYRSPVSGGGYASIGTTAEPAFTDATAGGGAWHYVVRARDGSGATGAATTDLTAAAAEASPSAGAPSAAPSTSPASSSPSAAAPASTSPAPTAAGGSGGIAEVARSPVGLLVLAFGGFAVGGAIAWWARRRRPPPSAP